MSRKWCFFAYGAVADGETSPVQVDSSELPDGVKRSALFGVGVGGPCSRWRMTTA